MPTQAWQPFTPRGVAAFAGATLTRLVLVQITVAALVALALLWFLRVAWLPVIADAIQNLPEIGGIQNGELTFGASSPVRLAGNAHLGIVVDVDGVRGPGYIADVEFAFERTQFVVRGPLGDWPWPYAREYGFSLNRLELEPAWGAWRGPLLTLIVLITIVTLFLSWWGLALLYLPLLKFITFFADRGVTWRGAWRVSAAALLPGASLVAVALILYAFGAIDLFRFGLLYVLHAVAGLIFVFTSPLFLPKIPQNHPRNPFASSSEPPKKTHRAPANPFGKPDDKSGSP